MLSITRIVALVISGLALLSCSRSNDSKLIGEWSCPAIGPMARVTYKADHTYSGRIDGVKNGPFVGEGTWRVEGSQMICRDYQHAESRAEILNITPIELQIKGPDGIISRYERIK
jgi:hypothetical protein